MLFDFVSEENKPYNKRDTATRHLIRKRATQAAARTKKDARATLPPSTTATTAQKQDAEFLTTDQGRTKRVLDTRGRATAGDAVVQATGGSIDTNAIPASSGNGIEAVDDEDTPAGTVNVHRGEPMPHTTANLHFVKRTRSEVPSLAAYPSPPSSRVIPVSEGSRAVSEDDASDQACWPQMYEAPATRWASPQIAGFLLSEQVQAILIGKIMSTCILQSDYIRLSKILGLTSPDFVSAIPEQYGRDPCLDAAIDCLSSRIQEFIPSLSRPTTSSANLYGRALIRLQSALSRSDGHRQYDIWLAVPILCIYELLSSERHHSWLLHAKGAATMLKHIGAHNINSNLHRALLMTQAPIMITEGIFTGTPCYLDEDDWERTIQACLNMTSGDYEPRSSLVVSLVLIMRHLPNLLLRTEDVVLHGQTSDAACLRRALEQLKRDFDDFHARWACMLSIQRLHYGDDETRMVRLAKAYAGSALCERLLYALSPSDSRCLESSALRSSMLVQEIINHSATHVPNAHARMALPAILATSIVESSSEWMATANTSGEGDYLDSCVFGKWLQAIRPFKEEADRALPVLS